MRCNQYMDTCTGGETGSCNCMVRQTCSSCESSCQEACQSGCQSKSETNRVPSTPSYLNVPSEILEGSNVSISWDSSSDPDGDSITYRVEKSIDNGSYSQVYSGSDTSCSDFVPNGARTVRYRLDVFDGYSSSSGYVHSNTVKVNPRNSAPVISGSDLNLGNKQEDFLVSYIVTDADADDAVTVTEQIDDLVIAKDIPITLGVSRDIQVNMIKFDLGEHKITITAKDKKGAISSRVYTFKKVNSAPIVTFEQADVGIITPKNSRQPIRITKFSVSDSDGDNDVTVKAYVDGVESQDLGKVNMERFKKGRFANASIGLIEFAKLKNGEHRVKIEATDSFGAKGAGYATFTKKMDYCMYMFRKDVDARATAIVVNPIVNLAKGAKMTVEVSINANSMFPIWEVVPNELIGQKYNFKEKPDTPDKPSNGGGASWAVGVRIRIDRADTPEGMESYFYGFVGAYM